MEGGLFGLLCHDMKNYVAKLMNLKSKRTMLRVSKWCYWWMKKHTVIKTVAPNSGSCIIECEYGHRTRCKIFEQRVTACIRSDCVYNSSDRSLSINVSETDQNRFYIGRRGTVFIRR